MTNNKLALMIAGVFTICGTASALEINQQGNNIVLDSFESSNYKLRVLDPAREIHTFNVKGDHFVLSADMFGEKTFKDGQYKYELTPSSPANVLAGSVRDLNDKTVSDEYQDAFKNNSAPASGVFTINSNSEMVPQIDENSVTTKDIVHNDDVIAAFSLCVGNDCVNGENFGFDTLRLKENNLRIHFQDTSNSGSFPSNDWRIVANDSTNGGANYLAIEDSDTGRTPFKIEASARTNSLYVDDGGRIGIGTNSPAVRVHLKDGNTPTLRLEQDGSSGFTAQTWDVAGNEANFFIRDTTNGSQLPFQIKPGADSASLFIAANNSVGVGTNSPSVPLHVKRNNNTAKILVEETNGTIADRGLMSLTNNGGSRLEFVNTSGGANANDWRMATENNTGSFIITEIGSGSVELEITTNGDIIQKGVTIHTSDRNKKKNIVRVDSRKILEKVNNLPISTWEYKDQDNVVHMGPMAQDFRAVFGLGLNDKTISDTDIIGVALASIQAINNIVDEKDKEIVSLKQRLDKLESTLISKDSK